MLTKAALTAVPLIVASGGFFSEVEPMLSLDARAESRARPAGQFDPDAFAAGEMELVVGTLLGFRHPSVGLAVRYAPSVTWTTFDPVDEPLLLHQGMARFHLDVGGGVQLVAAHLIQYGERNFTSAIVFEEQGGRRLRLEFLPEVDRLAIRGNYTRLGAIWQPSARSEYQLLGGYGAFGGRDEAARQRLPDQTGPWAALLGEIGVSPRDAILANTRFARTRFDPGPTFLIMEGEGGWRHDWDRFTQVAGLLGVFAGVNEEPLGDELTSIVLPTIRGELTRTFTRGRRDAELEIGVAARPGINQLYARLDPRITAEVLFEWWWRERFGVNLEGGRAWVLDEDLSLAGRLLVAGGGMSVPVFGDLIVQGGGRLFRQSMRFGSNQWTTGYWRWEAYLAVAFQSHLLP